MPGIHRSEESVLGFHRPGTDKKSRNLRPQPSFKLHEAKPLTEKNRTFFLRPLSHWHLSWERKLPYAKR
jgi:hypothetical protein